MRSTVARGAQGRAFEVGLCLSGDVGERLVRGCGGPSRSGATVRGRPLFVRAMSVSYGYCLHGGWDGFGAFLCKRRAKVAETWSNGPTNSASRVKSDSQLNANEQLSKCQRMFKGPRRALESQARTGSCRTSSNNQPSIASRKNCVINMIVSFVKKYGRSLLRAR